MSIQWKQELRFFPTLRGYRRRWLGRDLLAGVTFGAVTMPGQIATAHLAGMPPITGLYGFLVACLIGVLLSSNRQLAFGVDSTVAPILAAGLIGLGAVSQTPRYLGLALVTTFLVGVIILIVGVTNMGWVGDFLSRPVVIGFLGGIAIIIAIDQIPGMLGVESGHGLSVSRVVQLTGQVVHVNIPTLILGLTSLALLIGISKISPRIPGALIVLVLATSAVTFLDLTKDGVAVLGPLKSGLPHLELPPFSLESIEAVLGTATIIAVICLAQTAATSRSSAALGGFEIDINADFRALGAANVASSFVGSFTIDASPPSTTIIAESRGRTQAVALIASAMTLAVLFASQIIENLPTATLSAVLIYIAIKIFRVDQMRATKAYSWRAFTLMMITMFSVVLLGIVYGVLVAVVVSFANQASRTARPELLRLGRTDDGLWVPSKDKRAKPVDGVAAFFLNGPLWFGNANWFRMELIGAMPEGADKPRLLILDATRIDDIDFTGAEALHEIATISDLRGVPFLVVIEPGRTQRAFKTGGFAEELGKSRFFDTVEQAVEAYPAQPVSANGDASDPDPDFNAS